MNDENWGLKIIWKKTEVAWKIFWKSRVSKIIWKSRVSKIIWKLKFWQLNLKNWNFENYFKIKVWNFKFENYSKIRVLKITWELEFFKN